LLNHPPSLPGLTRQSIADQKTLFFDLMDARVIQRKTRFALLPAHDKRNKFGKCNHDIQI
jgi:hypothetical protein